MLCLVIYLCRKLTLLPPPKALTRSQENANLISVLLELDDEPREQLLNSTKISLVIVPRVMHGKRIRSGKLEPFDPTRKLFADS